MASNNPRSNGVPDPTREFPILVGRAPCRLEVGRFGHTTVRALLLLLRGCGASQGLVAPREADAAARWENWIVSSSSNYLLPLPRRRVSLDVLVLGHQERVSQGFLLYRGPSNIIGTDTLTPF